MKKVEITYNYDADSEMEQLIINGTECGLGNVWDSHLSDGLDTLEYALKIIGIPSGTTRNMDWVYDE